MANHQVNVVANGTKTLLTEGKYCDRNIDVVVNVPASGITPTGTINITENGTHDVTNYANANVNVPTAQPTHFTNILDLDTTIVKSGYRVTSTGYTATEAGVSIAFPITAGTHRLRARGKYTFGFLDYSAYMTTTSGKSGFCTNMYQSTATPTESTFTGTTLANHANFEDKGFVVGIDEYGDTFLDVITTKNCYLGFTMKDMSVTYPNGTFIDAILTLDEPIGNGGVV